MTKYATLFFSQRASYIMVPQGQYISLTHVLMGSGVQGICSNNVTVDIAGLVPIVCMGSLTTGASVARKLQLSQLSFTSRSFMYRCYQTAATREHLNYCGIS